MLIRLNKYLADHGVASRRKCDEYIEKGFVKVNGKVVRELGTKIDPDHDRIETSRDSILRTQNLVYYVVNKPVGYVCTVTGHEELKITSLLKNIPERIFPVGRLDKLTSGLLIITNDGRLAYALTHPKFEKEKEYVVKVREKVTPTALKILNQSFFIHGRKTAPVRIMQQSAHLLRVILTEGRNRQIRRMCQRAELTIEKLKRVRIGPVNLGDLAVGKYRALRPVEISQLLAISASAKEPKKLPAGSSRDRTA